MVTIVGFSTMLVATTKKEDPAQTAEAGGAGGAKSEAAPLAAEPGAKDETPTPQASIPSTDGWTEVTLDAAGVVLSVPPGAKVNEEASGNDEGFAGRYISVVMPSGYELYFAQDTGTPMDFAEQKRWYQEDANGFDGFVFEAADAHVARRKDGAPVGDYWEASACSPPIPVGTASDGKPLCARSAGASIEDDTVTKMTNDEVLAVVAIARSIKAK